SWIRKMAFGTEVAFASVAASVNVFAMSRSPETSIPAVGASHAPFTSPFPASVGKPEKSGSSGTRFNPAIAAATAELTSEVEARVGVRLHPLPARLVVEDNLLRHEVVVRHDRESVPNQAHHAGMLTDLTLLDPEDG